MLSMILSFSRLQFSLSSCDSQVNHPLPHLARLTIMAACSVTWNPLCRASISSCNRRLYISSSSLISFRCCSVTLSTAMQNNRWARFPPLLIILHPRFATNNKNTSNRHFLSRVGKRSAVPFHVAGLFSPHPKPPCEEQQRPRLGKLPVAERGQKPLGFGRGEGLRCCGEGVGYFG